MSPLFSLSSSKREDSSPISKKAGVALKRLNRRCEDLEHGEPRKSGMLPLIFLGGTRVKALVQWVDRGSRPYCICHCIHPVLKKLRSSANVEPVVPVPALRLPSYE
jgi:hypothetical protein